MSVRTRALFAVAAKMVLLWAIFAIRPAAAHGDDEAMRQLADSPAGPFTVSTWTVPGYARPGWLHFAVEVAEAGRPVPGGTVFVTATHVASGRTVTAEAVAKGQHGGYRFETDLRLAQAGEYEVTVAVADASGRTGGATFPLRLASVAFFRWLTAALVVFAVASTAWFVREGFTTWRKPAPIFRLRGESQ